MKVEEFMEGISLNKIIEGGDKRLKKEIARRGMKAFLKMMLVDNFVHADMHSGNILIQVNEKKGKSGFFNSDSFDLKLILIDVGLVSSLKDLEIYNFAALFDCLRTGDGKQAARLILGGSTHSDCKNIEKCNFFFFFYFLLFYFYFYFNYFLVLGKMYNF